MTIMGNHCSPRAVAAYERACGHDFIFSTVFPQHSVNGPTHPKDGDPDAATTGGTNFRRPVTDPSCVAEVLTSASPGGARSSVTLTTTARAAHTGASFVGQDPVPRAPTPATAAACPPAAVAGPFALYVTGCALILFGAVQLAATVGTY